MKWKPSSTSFVKLNFDEVAKRNPSVLGIGWVLRSCNREVLFASVACIPNGSNNMVKALAWFTSLRRVVSLGFKSFDLEGDSLNIISSLNKNDVNNWRIRYVLQEVRLLLQSLDEFKIHHCFREANMLANMGFLLTTGDVVLDKYDFMADGELVGLTSHDYC
ncbi:hypothetical protein SUGI_0767370 [Cryptomeria japonica]|nr:hypothetical protein SUGI_0767370 [Cryptomeria japonica]